MNKDIDIVVIENKYHQLSGFAMLIYLFYVTIIFQNIFALAATAFGIDIPISMVYIVKDILLLLIFSLVLASKRVYKFNRFDQIPLVIIIYIIVVLMVNSGSFYDQVMKLRFYMVPLILYFIGRNAIPFRKQVDIERFIIFLGVFYVVLSLVFIFIDRNFLLQIGMGQLLGEKLGYFAREDAVLGGYPINYYFYHDTGELTKRAFGALFDPLATAFMGAVLFFHLIEIRLRTKNKLAGLLVLGVGIVLMLTITRAIIAGAIIVLMLYQFRKTRIRYLPVMAIIFGVFLLVLLSLKGSLVLDPSSVAHIGAYTKVDFMALLVGEDFDPGEARGAESLYLTILKEYGVGLFSLYVLWVYMLYKHLRANFTRPFAYATLASMVVYLLASFTTEHWFIFSSGALFWFLLGNNLTVIQNDHRVGAIKHGYIV